MLEHVLGVMSSTLDHAELERAVGHWTRRGGEVRALSRKCRFGGHQGGGGD